MDAPKIVEGMSFREYLEAPGLNKSTLFPFYRSSLHGVHAMNEERSPTKSTRLGDLIHLLAQQRGSWSGVLVHTATKDVSTKAFRAEEAENPDALVVTQAMADAAERMYARLEAHPKARTIIRAKCLPEVSVFWREPLLPGEPLCKARLDAFFPGVGAVDLKSVAEVSIRKIEANTADFGYHAQAAWYLRAMKAVGIERPAFLFLWIESAAPHDCVVSEVPREDLGQGWAELEIAWNHWREWKETGTIRGIADHALTLGLPRYRQIEGLRPVSDPGF